MEYLKKRKVNKRNAHSEMNVLLGGLVEWIQYMSIMTLVLEGFTVFMMVMK